MRFSILKRTSSQKQTGAYIISSERCNPQALSHLNFSVRFAMPILRCCHAFKLVQVLPHYWPYEKSLQSSVLQALQSAEYGVGQSKFRRENLRVTNQTESDGHVVVSFRLFFFASKMQRTLPKWTV